MTFPQQKNEGNRLFYLMDDQITLAVRQLIDQSSKNWTENKESLSLLSEDLENLKNLEVDLILRSDNAIKLDDNKIDLDNDCINLDD